MTLFHGGPQLHIAAAGLTCPCFQVITLLTKGKPAFVNLLCGFYVPVQKLNVAVKLLHICLLVHFPQETLIAAASVFGFLFH